MPCKEEEMKEETALVPHRTPNLSALLERAVSKDAASAQAVKVYLDAGGSPSIRLVQSVVFSTGAKQMLHLPLLHYMALASLHPHTELAECVRLLIEAGANIDAMSGFDVDDRTALICASERKCCSTVLQAFLQNGADVITCNSKGMTALHQAAAVGRTDSCEVLLRSNSSLVHAEDVDGYTALIHAVRSGSVETVMVLQKHGAD
eukprot:11900-Heterococcus_DN1.PRE.1